MFILMEAANRGAREAGGRSVGCNIALPQEQKPNPYLDRWVTCRYFFVRKVLLFTYSYAFIALPGGVGTIYELFRDGILAARVRDLEGSIDTETVRDIVLDIDQTIRARYERTPSDVVVHAEVGTS